LNLNDYNNRHDLLIDWILETVPKSLKILDICANEASFCPEAAQITSLQAYSPGSTRMTRSWLVALPSGALSTDHQRVVY